MGEAPLARLSTEFSGEFRGARPVVSLGKIRRKKATVLNRAKANRMAKSIVKRRDKLVK
jgi:hypothetical protein